MSSSLGWLPVAVAIPAIVVLARYLLWPKPIPGIPHYEITSFWGDMNGMGEGLKKGGSSMSGFFNPTAQKLGPIYQVRLA